jgi:hypothetical protein
LGYEDETHSQQNKKHFNNYILVLEVNTLAKATTQTQTTKQCQEEEREVKVLERVEPRDTRRSYVTTSKVSPNQLFVV